MPVLIPKHSMLRPHGTWHVTNCDGPEFVRDTVMCGHCNRHGIFRPGCGDKLGKCQRCMKNVCPRCAAQGDCVTLEERLEQVEAGLRPHV